jgi:hypothetical protein
MKEFFKRTIKIATAIFIALIALAVAVGIFAYIKQQHERAEAAPFEKVHEWYSDASRGLKVKARTKLMNSSIWTSIEVTGYPEYLAYPWNASRSLNFIFIDQDGFTVLTKSVPLSEFTSNVDGNGKKTGLAYEFKEFMGLQTYKQIGRLQVGWNLMTDAPEDAPQAKAVADPCAPGLSRQERIKRLAQYGEVRETGKHDYTSGGHTVMFGYDGDLTYCR